MFEPLRGDRSLYEAQMDELRALAAWIVHADWTQSRPVGTDWNDYLFSLVYRFSGAFAQDIFEESAVSPATLNLFGNALRTAKLNLQIPESDVQIAHEDQLHAASGFWWEMRRHLGRFPEMAEEIADEGVTHLVCSGISGCVIGEYLNCCLEDLGAPVPVDHMVFKRQNRIPVAGKLPEDFSPKGRKLLLVEDVVTEPNTLGVMQRTLASGGYDSDCSLFTLEMTDAVSREEVLKGFRKIYSPQE